MPQVSQFSNVFTLDLGFSFDGENYESLESSTYSHRNTFSIGNYRGKVLATGCDNASYCYRKTELLDMATMKWTDGPDYPYGTK